MTIRVPEALRLYLATRCDDPEGLLVDLLQEAAPGRPLAISPEDDGHRDLRVCSLKATTVIARLAYAVEVTIVGKEWAVRAGTGSTDLMLSCLPEVLRGRAGEGLLRHAFDISFLPRDLEIAALLDQGRGVLIRCQPAMVDVALALFEEIRV